MFLIIVLIAVVVFVFSMVSAVNGAAQLLIQIFASLAMLWLLSFKYKFVDSVRNRIIFLATTLLLSFSLVDGILRALEIGVVREIFNYQISPLICMFSFVCWIIVASFSLKSHSVTRFKILAVIFGLVGYMNLLAALKFVL